jgi:hypothetical protein
MLCGGRNTKRRRRRRRRQGLRGLPGDADLVLLRRTGAEADAAGCRDAAGADCPYGGYTRVRG